MNRGDRHHERVDQGSVAIRQIRGGRQPRGQAAQANQVAIVFAPGSRIVGFGGRRGLIGIDSESDAGPSGTSQLAGSRKSARRQRRRVAERSATADAISDARALAANIQAIEATIERPIDQRGAADWMFGVFIELLPSWFVGPPRATRQFSAGPVVRKPHDPPNA